jgi:hypothetical protein
MSAHDQLLHHLIEIAGRTLAHFDAGDLDAAIASDGEYDTTFTALQQLVANEPFTAAHADQLTQLEALHRSCMTRASEFRKRTQTELGELAQARKVLSYAPAGDEKHRAPRYLDAAA